MFVTEHRLAGNSRYTKNLASAAAGVALFIAVIFGITNVPILLAQSPALPDVQASESSDASLPNFEVSSIKPDNSGSGMVLFGFPSGRFTVTNASPKTLIAWAYNINGASFQLSDDRILGGPTWISREKYDVEGKEDDPSADRLAKLPVSERNDQIRLMVQALLIDRFKLRIHHETRDLPVYALVVAKNGPKMTESTKTPSLRFRAGEINATAVPARAIAQMLSRQAPTGCAPPELEGREVRDETGLSGVYDFTLKWTPEPPIPAPPAAANAAAPETSGPSVFTALEEQLGLRLESSKAPEDVIVVDQIEKPSPN